MATATGTVQTTNVPDPASANGSVPPLQGGDQLTREEFERRYEAMPKLKKAELIGGMVFMPSPVNHRFHGHPHFNLITWMGLYAAATPGVEGGDNSSLRLNPAEEPQPDGCLLILPSHGGQARFGEDGYLIAAPDLIGEVAASSVSYDLHAKLNAYRQNGVREYVVWRVYERAIDWFVLRGSRFDPLAPTTAGIFQSEVLPGLWLDPAALMNGDLPAVVQAVQQGVATPEHAAFVARLQQAASAPRP